MRDFLTSVRQSEYARSAQWAYWNTPWGRDPFRISAAEDGAQGDPNNFVLSGIVWDEHMPLAIINQKMLKTNDVIDGCKVKEIYRGWVKVVCDDKPYELELFKTKESPALA